MGDQRHDARSRPASRFDENLHPPPVAENCSYICTKQRSPSPPMSSSIVCRNAISTNFSCTRGALNIFATEPPLLQATFRKEGHHIRGLADVADANPRFDLPGLSVSNGTMCGLDPLPLISAHQFQVTLQQR